MLRTLTVVLFAALLVSSAVITAPTAEANGIMVASDAGAPPIEVRRPQPMPTPGPTPVRVRPPQPVVLKGHSVSAVIRDGIAEVTIEQVFRNRTNRQLEGTYLFPLPDGATVSEWSMTMFGKMIKGEIIEADRAREIYRSIVTRRRDPGLLEYMGRGLFRARVFPILPNDDLTIRITYQQVLPEDNGTLEFRYPLGTDRMNGAPVESVVVDVRIESTQDLKAVYSPSHDVEIARDGDHKARVSYERARRRQDKDFLLYVGRSPNAVGFSLQSTKAVGEDGTFMAVFTPRTEVPKNERVAKDIVYVLDTSGSMADGKMAQAQNALIYGVSMLRPGDRFNVIGFGSAVHPFRDNLLDATAETKAAAIKWVRELEPRGGTNVEGALQSALKMRGQNERMFMVVFMTDGRPTIGERNTDVLVKGVEAAAKDGARIFTFGVGFDLDVGLLDRIAEISGGTRDYVMPEEDVEIVTSRFFRKVDSPVLADVQVEFGSGVYDVYPKTLPALFAGSQLVVFGRYREAGDRVIRLKGHLGRKEVVYEYEGTLQRSDQADYLPRLWAHRKIAFLLDAIRLHGASAELTEEVIHLATRHAIVTPYTAGLVVEESELQGRTLAQVASEMGRSDRSRGGVAVPSGSVLNDGIVRLGARLPRSPGPDAEADAPAMLPTPAAGGGGAPRPANSPDALRAKAKDSDTLKKMKEAAAPGDEADDGLAVVREAIKSVAGKTFVRRDTGLWVDRAWDGKTAPTKIEAWSAKYFELAESKKVARFLALGERVIFVHAGTTYEIVPAR